LSAVGASRAELECERVPPWLMASGRHTTLVWVDRVTVHLYLRAWLPAWRCADGSRHAVVAWDARAQRALARGAGPGLATWRWAPAHDDPSCVMSYSPPACVRRYHELAASKLLVSACVARAGGSVTIADADAIPVGNLTRLLASARADAASMVYFQHGRGQSYSPAQDDGSRFWGAPRHLGRFPSPGSSEARMGHCLAVMLARPGGWPLLSRAHEIMQATAARWWENRSCAGAVHRDFWDREPSRALMQESFAWALGERMRPGEPEAFHAASLAASDGRLSVARAGDTAVAYLPYVRKSAAFIFCRRVETSEGATYVKHFFGDTKQKMALARTAAQTC